MLSAFAVTKSKVKEQDSACRIAGELTPQILRRKTEPKPSDGFEPFLNLGDSQEDSRAIDGRPGASKLAGAPLRHWRR
jgi:hypothetical protein